MPRIKWDKAFAKILKKFFKKNPGLKKKFFEKIKLLEIDPFAHSLGQHGLSGSLNGRFAIIIDYDLRVIFDYDKKNDAYILGEIGSHDDVY